MIELIDIHIARGGTLILRNVSLKIGSGEKSVVTGPSGSGKTSLLLAIMGVFQPEAGRVLIDGKAVGTGNVGRIRQSIAFITQEPIMGAERVSDALLLPFTFKANRYNHPSRERIEEVLAQLHLDPEILAKPASKISAGEKQRIAVGRALLLDKDIFLVDEATSALDQESKAAVISMLTQPQFTVLSVSHDEAWIGRCAREFRVEQQSLKELR